MKYHKIIALVILLISSININAQPSVARVWNEALLEAIRMDFARPTVHARNLYHTSIAMWDAWAAYDRSTSGFLYTEKHRAPNVFEARNTSISHAVYRILVHRFSNAPDADITLADLRATMLSLGYDPDDTTATGNSPVAIGNRIASVVINYGRSDGANEINDYENRFYLPINPPLLPDFPGNPDILDPNRWQPLALDFFIDQSGNIIIGGFPEFLSPEWGELPGFALQPGDQSFFSRDGNNYTVFHDPGPPPELNGPNDAEYKAGFVQVVEWSGLLDPADGETLDISPNARGNNTLGTNDGTGYSVNPVTGEPYTPQIVPAGDYYRVLAEFWADGPDSETPPGHWFTIANLVSDDPDFVKQLGGEGPVLNDLEWDVKLYLALGGAMHDAAISAWSIKGWYDYIRPVSAIRYMCDQGQSSDSNAVSFDPNGILLVPDVIELVTPETIMPGGIHAHLAGANDENLGKIAVNSWRGPEFISDPDVDTAGVDWILCENWWPYQRPTFVTPPFAGYVSGHSTFSRAAAEVMTQMTGSQYFPGGLGSFQAPANEFLVFEEGPSVDITLQWASYQDAADECSLSRIYGGIHPPADDIPGRFIGFEIGNNAVVRALGFFETPVPVPSVNKWGLLMLMVLISLITWLNRFR